MGALCACSTTRHQFFSPTYDAAGPAAIKKVAVVGWAPHEHRGLAEVLGAVGTDLVKLRKNYLVTATSTAQIHWAEACGSQADGILYIRALHSQSLGHKQHLTLSLEMLRCRDGALLWRAEGSGTQASDDAKLCELVANYTSQLGPAGSSFAAPAFVILQDLVEALPNPVLSSDEVAEKLELES